MPEVLIFLNSEDGLSALIIETRHSCEIFVENIAGWKVRVGHDHKFWGTTSRCSKRVKI